MRRVLFTTSGLASRGSWIIRGIQLGNAVDGKAVLEASDAEIAEADLVVVVKRAAPDLLARIRKRGVPWVLDVLDCWPQPQGNVWAADQARQWLRGHIRQMAPHGLVCATEAMADDVADHLPKTTLYHHARPGQMLNPVRKDVHKVGYEGSERYLDCWRPLLEDECRKRGWQFVVNPNQLSDVDILVALRGGQWRGFATDRWKSNVKLANAQGSATPIICQPECGYVETASGGECFITEPGQLTAYFDGLSRHDVRLAQSRLLSRKPPMLFDVTTQYRQWLEQLS